MDKSSTILDAENILSSPLLKSIDSRLYKGISVRKVHSDGSFANSTLTIHSSNFWISVRADTETITGFIKEQYKKLNGFTLARFVDIAHITHVFSGFIGTSRLEKWSQKLDDEDRDDAEKKTVTIIHSDFQTLDLIAENAKDAKIIYNAIQTLSKVYRQVQTHWKKEDLLARYLWRDADRNCDNHVEWKEIELILQRLNIYDANAKALFLEKGKQLTYKEFSNFLQSFHSSGIPNGIWDRAFSPKLDTVSKRDFLERFLHKVQGELDATMESVNKIFQFLNIQSDTMNRSQFQVYLHSNANDLFKEKFGSDDSKSMSSYWINTSHNTYCTGNQLTSQSSVQMYLYALCRGCRSLEIDCWDGGNSQRFFGDTRPKPIPLVYHGHTLTSQITFANVIRCIRGWILENPDTFPIILSLENHCTPPFQLEMAKILRETLGNLLYIPELYDFSADSLPTPHELRGKVIIKGKLLSQSEIENDGDDEEDDDEDEDLDHDKKPVRDDAKSVKVSIIPALAKLTLLGGAKFKSLDESLKLHPTTMHSLSEHKVVKLLKQSDWNIKDLRKLNIHHITRVYPKGIRFDSSNLNPMPAWSSGCQMVALNIQVHDSAVMMNNGHFRANGGCGYVQKPSWMLRGDYDDVDGAVCKPLTVRIKILSGMCLPKPAGEKTGEIIDSYVILCMHDVDVGARSKNVDFKQSTYHSTKMIRDNGFSPVWNEKQFTEFHVLNPDVAILDFKVMDQNLGKDDEVCFSAIPVSSLRSGIRCVELFDEHNSRWGPFDFATLLVEIIVE